MVAIDLFTTVLVQFQIARRKLLLMTSTVIGIVKNAKKAMQAANIFGTSVSKSKISPTASTVKWWVTRLAIRSSIWPLRKWSILEAKTRWSQTTWCKLSTPKTKQPQLWWLKRGLILTSKTKNRRTKRTESDIRLSKFCHRVWKKRISHCWTNWDSIIRFDDEIRWNATHMKA